MKRNLKSLVCLLVVFSLMTSLALVGLASELKSEKLNALNVGDVVSLGAPISDIQILGCDSEVRAEDGATIFYGVTSGPPATFFVYNVDTGVIEDTKPLQEAENKNMAKVAYAVDLGPDGVVSIATQSYSLFFRYDTKTKELKNYGLNFEETAVMSHGFYDSEGNYYYGTYPSAKLLKWDKKTDKVVDLGTMIESGDYVRSMGGYQDKIFMGGIGNPTTEFVKYDIKTGKKTAMKMPEQKGVFTADDVNTFYAASTAGKYMFMRTKITGTVNGYILCVFDMEKEEWVDYIPRTMHLDFSGFYGDIVYFHNSLETDKTKAGLFTYNPATKEIKQVDGIDLSSSTYLVKPKVYKLKDQAKYPGETIVAGANSAGIILINLENKSVNYVKDTLPAQATNIRTIKAGYNNDLILSAYMGAKVVFYDTEKEQVRTSAPSVQVEGINVFDDKYYFGLYGSGAALSEFDPKQPGKDKVNPKQIGTLGKDQDRAFNIVDGGDKIIWGSYPNYGLLGGKVGVYDKKTKKANVYPCPKNQCIAGLAYKDGKIYGSTSVYGGLGVEAIDAPAKMFIMDAKTGKIEKEVEVKLKNDKNKQYFVGDMIFDKDGKLWVATVRTLLEVDPATLAIKQEIPIGSGTHKIDKVRALPYHLRFDKDGLLYTNLGNVITAIDTTTSETKQLYDKSTNGIDIADNGNLYFMDTNINFINKMILTRGNEVVDKFDTVNKAAVMLKVDNKKSFIKGTETTLDVPAQVVDDRTLVPVRFVSDAFGAKVDWNAATQTVKLQMPGKNITIVLGENKFTVNDKEVPLDVPATTIDERTVLPLRAFVEEGLGKNVFWDDRGLIVVTDKNILDKDADAETITKLVNLF